MALSSKTIQNETISVMPYPQSLQAESGKLRIISLVAIGHSCAQKNETIETEANRFLRRLNARALAYFEQQVMLNASVISAKLVIRVKEKAGAAISTNESYQLIINACL